MVVVVVVVMAMMMMMMMKVFCFLPWQHRSMEEAVREVTNAVLGHDGACLPGREHNPDFVEVSAFGG